MAWFEGRLYCGTFRAHLCFKQRQKENGPKFPVWPIKCPDDMFKTLDLRCADLAFRSRRSRNGTTCIGHRWSTARTGSLKRECGYRGMAVAQGRSDSKPNALCACHSARLAALGPSCCARKTVSTSRSVSKPGLGHSGVSSFRFLIPFNGRVFTSLVGSTNYVVNETSFPIVFESDDPASGVWRKASLPGFGEGGNSVIFNMATFNDHLYAGTFNYEKGFQLWKTRAVGKPPYAWHKVLDLGAGRGNLNQGVLTMCAFDGALYVGTCIQDGGYDRAHDVGPAAGEIIRVYPDDSWDLRGRRPPASPNRDLKHSTSGLVRLRQSVQRLSLAHVRARRPPLRRHAELERLPAVRRRDEMALALRDSIEPHELD